MLFCGQGKQKQNSPAGLGVTEQKVLINKKHRAVHWFGLFSGGSQGADGSKEMLQMLRSEQ